MQRITEQDIRESPPLLPFTFEVTVQNDTFSPFVGHRHIDPTATEALLAGIRSTQAEPDGWNEVVLPALKLLNVKRYSTSVVTVRPTAIATLPALS